MTTKINDRMVLMEGLELQPATQSNTAQTPNGVLLYISNGVLKMHSNTYGNLEFVTQSTTPPEVPPTPTATTIYGLCQLLRPLGQFSGQGYDSSAWEILTSNGQIGTWYKLTFDSCSGNGITPNYVTGTSTINYTGYYEISVTFGGNALSNKIIVMEIGLSFDNNPPPLVSDVYTSAQSEQTVSDVPISISGSFIKPLNAGDTVTAWVRGVAGTSGFVLKMYRATKQMKKI